MPAPTIKVYDPLNSTEEADLRAPDAQGQPRFIREGSASDELNENGDISCTVDFDHPHASAMSPYKVLRVLGDDGQPRMAGYVVDVQDVLVGPGDDADKVRIVECDGLLGLLGEAVVAPPNGFDTSGRSNRPYSRDRVFDVSNRWLDRTAWINAYVQTRGYDATQGLERPQGWAGTTADWIWCRPDAETQPVGKVPFYKEFHTATTIQVVPIISADNDYTLYIDEIVVGTSPVDYPGFTWWDAYKHPLELSPGFHYICIIGENWSTTAEANPAGVIFSLRGVDGDSLGAELVKSDTTWKTLNYPTPMPGLNAGQILNILWLEALGRGALGGWSTSFTNTHDSAGNPWPSITEFTCKIRDTIRDVIGKLCEGYIDVAADTEGLVLHAWDKDAGGRTGTSGLVLTPGENMQVMSRRARV